MAGTGEDGNAICGGCDAADAALVLAGGVLLQAATATRPTRPNGRHMATRPDKWIGAFRRMPEKKDAEGTRRSLSAGVR
jgi:hypothetical protein